MINPLFFALLQSYGAGPTPGPATVVQDRLGTSFSAATTVGNTVLWIIRSNGATPAPSDPGWVQVAQRATGAYRITVWAASVSTPATSFATTNSGNIWGSRLLEVGGLDNAALGTPQSLHTAAREGAYPATSFSGIADQFAFGLFVCGTGNGSAGGSPDAYTWAGNVTGEFHVAYTNDIYNQDQAMTGGGVANTVVMVISVAFKSG